VWPLLAPYSKSSKLPGSPTLLVDWHVTIARSYNNSAGSYDARHVTEVLVTMSTMNSAGGNTEQMVLAFLERQRASLP
jgi:hypothetical protein